MNLGNEACERDDHEGHKVVSYWQAVDCDTCGVRLHCDLCDAACPISPANHSKIQPSFRARCAYHKPDCTQKPTVTRRRKS